jgi:pilus assembly protein Flp/PilA
MSEFTMMSRGLAWLMRFLRSDDGPSAIEYAVLLSLIVAVCAVALHYLGVGVRLPYLKLINAGALGH